MDPRSLLESNALSNTADGSRSARSESSERHEGGATGAGRRVRLICTDLDGTLLNSQGLISDRSLHALAEAAQAGLPVVGITGRPARDALDRVRGAGLTGPVVCSNGAITVDAQTGQLVNCHGFCPTAAGRILARLRTAVPGIALGVDFLTGLYLEPEFARLVPHPWPHLPLAPGSGRDALTTDDPVVKIVSVHPEHPVDKLSAILADLVGDQALITRSTGHFIEMSAPGVDKGQALRRLAAADGIPVDLTAAIGDMPNDIPMLQAAGLAAAVANAHEDTLRIADIVLPRNDDDGVAALIRLVLSGALGGACAI